MNDNLAQVELAKETLGVLVDQGANLSETRHVIHFFYGGDFDALARQLAELGYDIFSTVENDGVIAERFEVIGEEWRTTTLAHLCEMADMFGVEYDGWEASVGKVQSREELEAKEQAGSDATEPEKSGFFAKFFGKK